MGLAHQGVGDESSRAATRDGSLWFSTSGDKNKEKIQPDNATSNLPWSLLHLLDYRLQLIHFIPFTDIFVPHPHRCLMFELSALELFTRNCLTHFRYAFIQSLHSLCFVRCH